MTASTPSENAIILAKSLHRALSQQRLPPSDGIRPKSEMVLPMSLMRNTRSYIEKVTYQINGCYEQGWYDGCAVMMRRLLETLIIETFEKFQIASRIKNSQGEFFYLSDLIAATLSQSQWNLGRSTKAALPRLKTLGDQSAHGRRYVAHREDVDNLQNGFRTVVQELLFLSRLK